MPESEYQSMLAKRRPRQLLPKKFISSLLLFTFTNLQIVWADPTLLDESGIAVSPLTETSPEQAPASSVAIEDSSLQTSTEFLGEDSPLSPSDEESYEYRRYQLVDALELLRPEFASAVILERSLTKEELENLRDYSIKEGIEIAGLILHGETVLVTTGSGDEIAASEAARKILERATFAFHIHPDEFSKEGPTGPDLEAARDSIHYLLTSTAAYAYTREGILDSGDLDWFLTRYLEAYTKSQQAKDERQARDDLNLLIAEQDKLNQISKEAWQTWLAGGTISYTSGLTAASVTTLPGSPYPYFMTGSSSSTTLAVGSDGRFQVGYNVTATGSSSGMTISFDNASTSTVETQNLSTQTYITFGLQGVANAVKVQFVDVNGNKDLFTLTNLSSSQERFWRISTSTIVSTVDKTRIKQIDLFVDQSTTSLNKRTGTGYIRSYGLNTNPPVQPVVTNTNLITNQNSFVLTGTKEANTSIFINGAQAAALNSSTTWTATVNLSTEGNNTFNISSKNSIGKVSSTYSLTIVRDTVAPTGTVKINSDVTYATSQNVTLSLTGSDATSGVDQMHFSTDGGTTWTSWENFSTSKSFTLPSGDGTKEVRSQIRDKAGNLATFSDTIILDTTPPSGSIQINNNATYTGSTSATLTLSATDATSGIQDMGFSNDQGTTWSAWEPYATTKSYTILSGDGVQYVKVRYRDRAGLIQQYQATITLDVTPPTGSIQINNGVTLGAAYTKSTTVYLVPGVSDSLSGLDLMHYSVDGGISWSNWESPFGTKSITLPSGDGTKQIRLEAQDKAGNRASFSTTILLDTVSPTGSIEINSGASYTNSTTVSLNLTTADSGSGIDQMSFSTNGTTWTAPEAYASTRNWTLSSGDGFKTVYVKFWDRAGNESAAGSATVFLDTMAPTGTLTINSGSTFTNELQVTATLSAQDEGSGVSEMRFSFDGAATWSDWEAFQETQSLTLSVGEGLKQVRAQIKDRVGHVAELVNEIVLDTVPPTGSIQLNSGANYTNSLEVSLNLSADDGQGSGLATMSFSTDSGAVPAGGNANWTVPEPYAASRIFTVSPGDGEKVIGVKYYDIAGNASVVYSRSIILDTTAPAFASASPSTTDLEVYEAVIQVDGQNQPSQTWRLGRGFHNFIAEATDLTGNRGWSLLSVTRTGILSEATEPPTLPAGDQMTTTLADGSVATYVSGQLVKVTTATGIQLMAPTLDVAGQITGGWLVTPEGAMTYFQNGSVVWARDPSGTVTWYFPEGVVEAVRAVDGTQSSYAYQLNATGGVSAILVTTSETSTLLDASGLSLKQLRSDGRLLSFSQGRLSRIEFPGTLPIDYTETTQPDGSIVGERPTQVATDLPLRFVYGADNTLLEVTQADGTFIRFTNGLPTEALAADGTVTRLTTEEARDFIKSLSVTRGGVTRNYDAKGVLTSLTLSDQTVLTFTGEALQGIKLADGTRITEGVFDAASRLVSGLVNLADGREVRYANGEPVEARLPGGTTIAYTSGQPSRLLLATGSAYDLTRQTLDTVSQWIATLVTPVSGTSTSSKEALTKLIYSDNWILQAATRSDGAILSYVDARLNTLTQSDGTVISYAYDTFGRLTNTLARSPDPNEPLIRSEYTYDRIRRVFRGETLVYEYSYEFDAGGNETTVIHEPATDLTKRYRDGLLLSQTDADGAVTTYEYTSDPRGYVDPLETAVAMIRTFPSGLKARYDRVGTNVTDWSFSGFINADDPTLKPSGQVADTLSDVNGVTQAAGKIGNAAHFSPVNEQYLGAPDSPDLSMGDIDFTVSVWVYLESKPNGDMEVFHKGPGGQGNPEYRLRWENAYDRFSFQVTDGTAPGDEVTTSGFPSPQTNTWHHLLVWHDSVSNVLGITLDNAYTKTVSYASGGFDGDYPFEVGRRFPRNSQGENYWDGRIDELAVWKRSLTGQERLDLYNAGAGNGFNPATQSFAIDSFLSLRNQLVAYWTLEEPSGTRADATDVSSLTASVDTALPQDIFSLRRMIDAGELQLLQPDALDRALETATGATRTLAGGTQVRYTRNGPGLGDYTVSKLLRPDGTELIASGQTADALTETNGVGQTQGKIGNAAQFTRAGKQLLSLPDQPQLNFQNTGFSVSAWVNFDTAGGFLPEIGYTGQRPLFAKGSESSIEYGLYTENNSPSPNLRFLVSSTGRLTGATRGDDFQYIDSAPNILPHQWYFFVASYNAQTHLIELFLNNVSQGTAALPNGLFDGASPLEIGRGFFMDSNPQYMDGRVDEMAIWNRPLSAQERADLFNNGQADPFLLDSQAFSRDTGATLTDQLLAYYDLNETAGTRADATDLSTLIANAALPSDRVSLRQMVEQGSLQLIGYSSVSSSVSTSSSSAPVLARSIVSYQGKVRERFSYRYENGLTQVTDSGGVTRTYDGTNRLVAIEQPDGTRYSITLARDLSEEDRIALEQSPLRTIRYLDLNGMERTLDLPAFDVSAFDTQRGEEVTIQSLTERLLKDGTRLTYKFGQLEAIYFPDGRVLDQFTVDRNGIPLRGRITSPDGTVKNFQNGGLIEVTRSDGVRLRYRDGSLVEIYTPINVLQDATISRVELTPGGQLDKGEMLLPSGDRLTLQGGRFSGARLADGTEVQSVNVALDSLTGATLSVSGSTATLSDTRDVGVTLSSGQQYRYRYRLDGNSQPTNELESMTFRDDFEDGNALGWRTTGDWSMSSGDLRGAEMNFSDSAPSIYAQTGLNWADYTLSTSYTYEQLTGKSSEARILFRYQDDNNYYTAETIRRTSDPHQGWHLMLGGRVGGQSFEAAWIPLSGFSDGGRHTLSVEVSGSTFRIFLDGSYQGSFSDGRLSRGSVGYSVRTAVVRFHDLEVTFPGEDLRDPATRDVDTKLRTLRDLVAQATSPILQIGTVAATFDSNQVDPNSYRILEESSDPDVRLVVDRIHEATADPSLPLVSELSADGQVLTSVSADGSVTLYDEDGRPISRFDQDGLLQVTYAYDTDGYLSKVTYIQARKELVRQIDFSRAEVERRAAAALEALAQQKGISIYNLQAQIQVARDQLTNQNTVLEGQLQNLESTPVKGREGRRQKSRTLDQLRQGLNQIRDAQMDLEIQYQQALSNLDAEIQDLRSRVQSNATSSFAEINSQEEDFTKKILRQELEPILYQQYRIGIGRDPSEGEITNTVSDLYAKAGNNPEAILDLVALREQIQILPDYAGRVNEVVTIRAQVTDWLSRYVRAPPEEKQSLIAELGLNSSEIVPLSESDADRILAWLNSRSLHFGHSAFLALKELLAAYGVVAQTIEIGRKSILIDILVGVLNPKIQETAELELSVFSLQRVARLYGVQTTPSQVLFNDLRLMLSSGPAIAHVNGNHYILVQSIAADGTVTYRESNAGPNGQTLAMSQDTFLQQWQGTVLSARGPPNSYQLLSVQESQSITGSFFPILFAIFAAVASAVGTAVSAVVAVIGSLLASLGSLLTGIFNAFGAVVSGFFNGLGAIFSGNLLGGLATIGQGFFTGLTGLINAGLGFLGLGSLSQLGTLAGLKTALTHFAIHTILPMVTSLAVTKGLEALGVNPAIAGLISAFVTGGITGGLSGASAGMTFAQAVGQGIVSGIQAVAVQGTQMALVKAGVDVTLANLGAVAAGAIVQSLTVGAVVPVKDAAGNVVLDANGQPYKEWIPGGLKALGATLQTQLLPTVAGELAFYGVQKLGQVIGLDPRISQLIGAPIRSFASTWVSPASTTQSVIQAIGDGLARGAISVGVQFATEGLDPLLGGFASAAVLGAIDGILGSDGGPVKGIFAGIGESVSRALGGFKQMGVFNMEDPVATAQRLQQLTDFTTIIKEQGLADALEQYATSFLHQSSIESLLRAYGSVKRAIETKLAEARDTQLNNEWVKELRFSDLFSIYLTPETYAVRGIQEEDRLAIYDEIRADRSRSSAGMVRGRVTHTEDSTTLDGFTVTARVLEEISAGGVTRVVLTDKYKRTFVVNPHSTPYVLLNADGTISDGILIDSESGATVFFLGGESIRIHIPGSVGESRPGLDMTKEADGSYRVEITKPQTATDRWSNLKFAINDKIYDGLEWIQSNMTKDEVAPSLAVLYASGDYVRPGDTGLGEGFMDFLKRAVMSAVSQYVGAHAANVPEKASVFFGDYIAKDIVYGSKARLLTRDLLLRQETSEIIAKLWGPGTVINSVEVKLDPITVADVERVENSVFYFTGFAALASPGVSLGLEALSLLEKSQPVDPTQTRYSYFVDYTKDGQHKRMRLEFTTGEYITLAGNIGYGVIQSNLQIVDVDEVGIEKIFTGIDIKFP